MHRALGAFIIGYVCGFLTMFFMYTIVYAR